MKIFAPDLKEMMKDCILALFWPKKKIYAFFKDHHCPKPILQKVEAWEEKALSRRDMVELVFSELADRNDNGHLQFNLMLESLCKWQHFDDYWFNQQQKLDISQAKQLIAKLAAVKENSIDKAKERTAKLREKAQKLQEKEQTLEDLRNAFYEISQAKTSPQNRGYSFEKFLMSLARHSGLRVTESFRVHGTQIDGTIKHDGENYVVEAKWHNRELSDEPLLAFCAKQEMNMHGRGIFISINGVTEGALSMLGRTIKNTILVDGEDITLVLNEMISLTDMLDAKIHAAQTQGNFYINPVTGKSKIQKAA